MTGILVLVSDGSLATILALRFNLGDLLMVAACLCYGAYTVALAKRLEMPPVLLLCFFAFCAFLAMLILSETMYLYHIMALLMVLGGIFFAQFGKAKT